MKALEARLRPLTEIRQDLISSAIEEVETKYLQNTIFYLQSFDNRSTWEKQWASARWLEIQFKSLGIGADIHTYEFTGKKWPNIIARFNGYELPEEIVMLTAHIDSVSDDPEKGAPGADDDGTGVAVILETARILKSIPLRRTVMFCFFSNEEQGSIGSKAYAQQAKQNGLDIRAVINLDVLGYNRPTIPLSISAINAHKTVKHKIKAFLRMARNFIKGLPVGSDAVKVAGRERNRELVEFFTQAFRKHTNIKVKEFVSDDCE